MMSKVTTLLFALLLATGFAGCGDSGKSATANKPAEKPAAAPASAPAPTTAPAEAGKKVEGAMKEEAKKNEGAGTEKPK
ncbi:MAG: hypothetical protein BWK79_17230 [Beggiatoa sp. IS2]|nr:MAG: hypothetical protein BWK79_17230 [Beggiatoa sp. IS2]